LKYNFGDNVLRRQNIISSVLKRELILAAMVTLPWVGFAATNGSSYNHPPIPPECPPEGWAIDNAAMVAL